MKCVLSSQRKEREDVVLFKFSFGLVTTDQLLSSVILLTVAFQKDSCLKTNKGKKSLARKNEIRRKLRRSKAQQSAFSTSFPTIQLKSEKDKKQSKASQYVVNVNQLPN